jgi:hypothetical protein
MTTTPGALRYHANEARRDVEYWERQAHEHEAAVKRCRKQAEIRLRQAEEYEQMAGRGEIVVEYMEAAE